jgi:hypothetical protein
MRRQASSQLKGNADMRLRHLTFFLAPAIFTGILLAQDNDPKAGGHERTTMTGCLTKGSDGNYILTDEKTGRQTTVTGTADLEKHSAGHKVQLTGTENTTGGTQAFSATSIKHISATCTPGPSK